MNRTVEIYHDHDHDELLPSISVIVKDAK